MNLDVRECVRTDMNFQLQVNLKPQLFIPDPIVKCNDQVTTVYDLTLRETQITNNDPTIILTYFETQLDLDNNNPIPNLMWNVFKRGEIVVEGWEESEEEMTFEVAVVVIPPNKVVELEAVVKHLDEEDGRAMSEGERNAAIRTEFFNQRAIPYVHGCIRKVNRQKRNAIGVDIDGESCVSHVFVPDQFTRSMMVAVPMPAPMHKVVSAVDLPDRSSSSNTVPRRSIRQDLNGVIVIVRLR